MKLVRYGAAGREKPGIIDAAGRIRDLSGIVADIAGETLSLLFVLPSAKVKPDTLPPVRRPLRRDMSRQFHRHRSQLCRSRRRGRPAGAQGAHRLNKAPSCICGPDDDTVTPKGLAARLRGRARRDRQPRPLSVKEQGDGRRRRLCASRTTSPSANSRSSAPANGPRARAARTFGPRRPLALLKERFRTRRSSTCRLTVNGETRQKGSTKTMIFGVAHLVWYCSQFLGAGAGRRHHLRHHRASRSARSRRRSSSKPRDVVKLGIAGLGRARPEKVVRFRM